MRIGVLAQPESWYFRDLARAADSLGHAIRRIDFHRIMARASTSLEQIELASSDDGVSPENLDALIVRSMPPGSLEQVVFRMDVLGRLERQGVAVVNSAKSLEGAIDKYLTSTRLAACGIPTPRTMVCEGTEAAQAAFVELGGDVVVKPLFGSEGRGIVRVSDPDLAWRTFRAIERLQGVIYLQEFVDHPGYDTRVLVLDGEPLGAIRRTAADDFRTNVSRSATAAAATPSQAEIDLAIRAARELGTRIAGVDLLASRDGRRYVIEVNAVPGWQAFARATGIDVADRLLRSIAR